MAEKKKEKKPLSYSEKAALAVTIAQIMEKETDGDYEAFDVLAITTRLLFRDAIRLISK